MILTLCAACSPPAADLVAPDMDAARVYATQMHAPPPDYRTLLAAQTLPAQGVHERLPTVPLPRNARVVGDLWLNRLRQQNALRGYGLDGKGPDGGVAIIDTGLTATEFDRWTQKNKWPVPRHIRWGFVTPLNLPPVSDSAQNKIRIWPASTSRTGAQPQALFHGRVVLRDGCFLVGEFGQEPKKLAWFHAEMGLDRDGSGYLVLRDRISGHTLARIGEELSWGGPASAEIPDKARQALQQACGPQEILVVGSPESSERFMTQYPHLRSPRIPPPPATAPG